jgi:hypothetical protein
VIAIQTTSRDPLKVPVGPVTRLGTKRFNVQVSKVNVKQQKENIFHTRCHIKNKVCSMIIDNVLISFLEWRYKDEVLCGVVPMHVAHHLDNLIGRPSMVVLKIDIH